MCSIMQLKHRTRQLWVISGYIGLSRELLNNLVLLGSSCSLITNKGRFLLNYVKYILSIYVQLCKVDNK